MFDTITLAMYKEKPEHLDNESDNEKENEEEMGESYEERP